MTPTVAMQTLLPQPIEQALERVRAALKAQGFGVLSEIDVQRVLHERLGAELYPYYLLGVCNPDLAYRALELDPSLGTFMPCTVAVYDTGAGTSVRIQDPGLALQPGYLPELGPLVETLRVRLGRVIASLANPDSHSASKA